MGGRKLVGLMGGLIEREDIYVIFLWTVQKALFFSSFFDAFDISNTVDKVFEILIGEKIEENVAQVVTINTTN